MYQHGYISVDILIHGVVMQQHILSHNGEPSVKVPGGGSIQDGMWLYDHMPKRYRDVLKDSTLNLMWEDDILPSVSKFSNILSDIEHADTQAKYHCDHPEYYTGPKPLKVRPATGREVREANRGLAMARGGKAGVLGYPYGRCTK